MKKQTPTVKSTAKTRTSASKVRKPAAAKKAVAAKKAAAPQRKGILHHTKRLYHLTPKFVHGMLIGAVIGIVAITYIGSTGDAHANPQAAACIKTQGGINVNQQNANVSVKLDDGCGVRTFVMKAWYAPSSTGEPHDEQRLFARSEVVKVKTRDNDWVKINVKALPSGCFYQYDLVDITDGEDGGKNPIPAAVTGGNRDCTPRPEYNCNSMSVKQGANRQVVVDSFNVTAVNATLERVVINWDYPNSQAADTYNGSPIGTAQHTYTKDGTYKIYAVATFKITGRNGEPNSKVAKQACTAQVTFNPVTPGKQQVCEFASGKIVEINEGTYDTNVYGPTSAKECNPTVTVTNTGETSGEQLTNTGPGAVLAVVLCAIVGGFVYHHTHRHIKSKKQHKHKAKHA
jgi:hypothetical protein